MGADRPPPPNYLLVYVPIPVATMTLQVHPAALAAVFLRSLTARRGLPMIFIGYVRYCAWFWPSTTANNCSLKGKMAWSTSARAAPVAIAKSP